jgi:hypothetical protein
MKTDRNQELRDLESRLLQLDAKTRAALARVLLSSLDDISDEEYEQLWIDEAEGRYADFLAGLTGAVAGDEVIARARARLR